MLPFSFLCFHFQKMEAQADASIVPLGQGKWKHQPMLPFSQGIGNGNMAEKMEAGMLPFSHNMLPFSDRKYSLRKWEHSPWKMEASLLKLHTLHNIIHNIIYNNYQYKTPTQQKRVQVAYSDRLLKLQYIHKTTTNTKHLHNRSVFRYRILTDY